MAWKLQSARTNAEPAPYPDSTSETEAPLVPDDAVGARLWRRQSGGSHACPPEHRPRATWSIGGSARLQGDDLQRSAVELRCARPREPQADDYRDRPVPGRGHRRHSRARVDPSRGHRSRPAGRLRLLRRTELQERGADPAEEGRLLRWSTGHGHPSHGLRRVAGCHVPRGAEPAGDRLRGLQYPYCVSTTQPSTPSSSSTRWRPGIPIARRS